MQTSDTVSIPELRSAFTGRVIGPDDDGYDDARTVFYGGFERRPAVIIRPTDANEVARVISLARDTGLELAVRSGAHSLAGHSVTEGGIVLDLSAMKALDIDVERLTAWAQAGLTAAEYTTATGAHGLATGFGDQGSVGLGGITLGGGVGFLSRKYGLTIDSLLAAEVVTADGQILHVDADSQPDLFWAIRGGGGNFGVATRFRYRLHEVGTVTGGNLFLPATPEVIAGFIAEAEAAPEELSTIANVMPLPPMPFIPEEHHGRLGIWAFVCHSGGGTSGEEAVARFRALAPPVADQVKAIPYPGMYPPEEEGAEEYHPTAVDHTMFIDSVDRKLAETIVAHLEASDAEMRNVQLRVLGGAVARVPADATAYAHREAPIMAIVASFYDGPEDKVRRQAWVDDFAAALDQGRPGGYVNFIADEGPDRVRDAYPGSTWDRLAEIKSRYDPENLFRLNQNIAPASQETGR